MRSDFGAPRRRKFFTIRFFRIEREKNKTRLRHILAFSHSCNVQNEDVVITDTPRRRKIVRF